MKLYAGERRRDGTVKVVVWDDVSFGMRYARYSKLDPRPDLAGGAADAFDWGRASRGADALAAAILADCAGDAEASAHCEAFARSVVSKLGPDRWKLEERAVVEFIERTAGRAGAPVSANDRPGRAAVKTEQQDQPQLAALAAWLAGGRTAAGIRGLSKRPAFH